MADFADRATAMADKYLREALANVGQADNGVGEVFDCLECGAKIPEGRRKAVPGVELCVKCQEKAERG